ncbi:MAG: HAMP domain-containing protein [Rhizobiales bacterium]|nr:HAMP domain-containing protein [Rhizobacter sp.]
MRFWNPDWLRSLRSRLIAAYAVGMLLTAGLAALAIVAITWQADALTRRGMTETAQQTAANIEFDAAGRPVKVSLPEKWQWVHDELPRDIELRVVDSKGNVVPTSLREGRLLPTEPRLDPSEATATVVFNGRQASMVSVPIPRSNGDFYLQMAGSDRLISLVNRSLHKPKFGGVLATIVLAMPILCGLMLWALSTLLRPLREVSRAAARIDARNLSARLSADESPKELVPLIDAFNLALERLEHGFRIQQQFLSAAAHELKTPLALMRGQIELGGLEDRETLLRDIDIMARHVHQLLYLAEVSESRNYKMESFAVADVAVDVVSFLSRMADLRRVKLDLHLPGKAVAWQGDKSALFTLLKNLAENAIQHSPAGGVVTLAVDDAGLTVRDEGRGVDPAHAALVFVRFWRAGSARGVESEGAGLGLAICQEIALAHGWSLHLCSGGKGASFRLDVVPADVDSAVVSRPAAPLVIATAVTS